MAKKLPYEVAKTIIYALYSSWEKTGFDEEYGEYLVAPLKDILHCIPTIHTGYSSEETQYSNISSVTKDHYFSRTRTSRRMLELMRKGILTENRMVPFLKSRARVHFVTSEQNKLLYTRNKNPPHWTQQYKNAGIVLVPWLGDNKRKI